MKDKFYAYIQNLQNTITSKLEEIDGKAKFQEDIWKRPEGGGGRTRVIENGAVFEKGGVNISGVHGELPKSMQAYFGVEDADFFACGLSLVLVCKKACDAHHPEFHSKYKKRCDEYFWNTHRNEARGLGGLFFDYCKATKEMRMQDWYNFVTEVGDSFLDTYIPIVIKRKDIAFTTLHRDWQEIRRGRYVEFNLVHDKGTLFGLKTNGRIESILMSLPPHVQWRYDHQPEKGSEEAKLLEVLKNPKEWV